MNKRSKQSKPKSQKAPRRIKASSHGNIVPKRDNRDVDQLTTDWVPFFRDSGNVYINDLALRYRRTTTMGSIINAKHNYANGKDFTYHVNGEQVDLDSTSKEFQAFVLLANGDMQSLREVFSDAMFNWILSGNVIPEVIKSGDFTGLDIQDSTKFRISVDKRTGFLSGQWRDIGTSSSTNRFKVARLPMWDNNIETTETNFLIHLKRRVPEFDFYGLPDHISTLKDADIEYKVDTYNLDRLDNGLFPTLAVTLIGEPPDGMTEQQYVDAINKKFTGEGQGGKNLIQMVDDISQRMLVDKLSNDNEGEFLNLEESAIKGQARGHRWPNVLTNIETAGKIGSNQEVITQWMIAMNNLVIPDYQEPILRLFNNILLPLAGFEEKLGLINKPPVGLQHMVDGKRVLSMNEQREQLGVGSLEELQGEFLIKETDKTDFDGGNN